mmetsp:Transcript_13612/g.17025  ORF Transcript_13612/g.17025 Transcript_13612/m.17025 type:complete len:96 (+) Transcript_13612:294-581(+)
MITDGGSGGRPEATLYFDGGAKPNPGIGGAGFLLEDIDGYHIDECAVGIDNYKVTNNHVITGLQCALEFVACSYKEILNLSFDKCEVNIVLITMN